MKEPTLCPRPQRCQARQPAGVDVTPLQKNATAIAAAVGAILMLELATNQRFSLCKACIANLAMICWASLAISASAGAY